MPKPTIGAYFAQEEDAITALVTQIESLQNHALTKRLKAILDLRAEAMAATTVSPNNAGMFSVFGGKAKTVPMSNEVFEQQASREGNGLHALPHVVAGRITR